MRKLSPEKRAAIISALVEGNSIDSPCRIVGVSKVTVLRLLADVGTFCAQYHNLIVRDLQSKRVQLDEIWSFCGCKDKAKDAGAGGHGSVWTWTAIDADSKLCISFLVSTRDVDAAVEFCTDVADRLANRVQLTSDGYNAYLQAVDVAFSGNVDYAKLVKICWASDDDRKYSPAVCQGCKTEVQAGYPDEAHISTSFVERQNLTLRMSTADSLGSQMRSQKSWKTTLMQSHCTIFTTILSVSIKPSEQLQQLQREPEQSA